MKIQEKWKGFLRGWGLSVQMKKNLFFRELLFFWKFKEENERFRENMR